MNNLVENLYGHNGSKKSNPIKRWIGKQLVPKAQASVPFNWASGIDNSSKVSKIKNQFQSYSCWGQATSYMFEILTGEETSAKSLYAPSAAQGGGVELSVGEANLTTLGANLEPTVPSYKPDGTTDELWMTNLSFRTQTNITEAMTKVGYKSVVINIDMDSIAHAIEEYGCVIVELEGKNGSNWLSANPLPPVSYNPNTPWYHYMCFVGAGQPLGYQRLKALNSWGVTVGEQGHQYFQSNYLPYFLNVVAFYKPIIAPPSPQLPSPVVPVEIPLQSTSTIQVTHPSSFWVSLWKLILSLIEKLSTNNKTN